VDLFDLKYALSSGGPPLLESGVQMKRFSTDHLESRDLLADLSRLIATAAVAVSNGHTL
jgi:hypothetical protein